LPQNNIPVGNTLIIEEEKTEIKTVVFDFEGKKRAFAFSEGRELKIGRKNADVILKHSEVSSLHLLFSMTNGRLFFWNKGKNGTFINGVKVENGELNEGRYRFIIAGKYELLISVEREKSAESFYKGSLAPYFERIESWVYQTDLFSKHPIILITGESGSGKEIFAEFTHDISKRKGPFVTFNAAAVPETLVESELFGTAKGGFTDATDKNGGFLNADKGTLFLDEIAEMPVNLQSKLLRVLEDWQIKRVGESGNGKKVNVMVVLATNVNLKKAIEEGTFRKDLYFRISTLHIHIPPLRKRKEDIIPLAKHLFYSMKGTEISFTEDAKKSLLEYEWPGNVRELKSVMTQFAYSGKDIFDKDDFFI